MHKPITLPCGHVVCARSFTNAVRRHAKRGCSEKGRK